MKQADLTARNKERSSTRRVQQVFVVTLIGLLLAGCGEGPATTGTISGNVLGHNGKPLGNIYEEETMIVALFCTSDDSDVDCLHEDFWDLDGDVVIASICEADDASENCLLHWGQGAATVGADGSYTLAEVPPGQYGVVFMFNNPAQRSFSLSLDLEPVEAGEISEYDVKTDLERK